MGEGGVYNVPGVRRALLCSVLTCMGIQEPLSLRPSPEIIRRQISCTTYPFTTNPGCYPDAELIQFSKGIVVCRKLCVMLWFIFILSFNF